MPMLRKSAVTQEEKIIARINELGFPIIEGDPMRQTLLDLADTLTKKAAKGGSSPHLLTVLGLIAFTVTSLCPK